MIAMRVTVDESACCSSGFCSMTAPEVFGRSDDTGTVVLLLPEPDASLHADVREAVAGCPSRAIELVTE
jgi:ferredoxin